MRIGVDVGATKIEAAALGAIEARKRVATPKGYDELLTAIVDLVLCQNSAHSQAALR